MSTGVILAYFDLKSLPKFRVREMVRRSDGAKKLFNNWANNLISDRWQG